jgi:hypothetical protein
MTEKINERVIDPSEQNKEVNALAEKTLPWLFGAGIAAGHLITSSNCTIPQQGKCAVCGGCVVALGSLVAWAVVKKKSGHDFYSQRDDD